MGYRLLIDGQWTGNGSALEIENKYNRRNSRGFCQSQAVRICVGVLRCDVIDAEHVMVDNACSLYGRVFPAEDPGLWPENRAKDHAEPVGS